NFLNAMDVFVLPSLCEGMSNTLLEAMACGLPVLATRVGGNPEVVEENTCGWLFTPGDAAQLAVWLQRLMLDGSLRCQLGIASRKRAVRTFSLTGMVENYSQLYLELAERRHIPRGR